MTPGRFAFPGLLALILLLGGCVLLPTESSERSSRSADNGDSRVEAALREALRVGTDRTVAQTNRVDGYLADEAIRIALPQELQSASGRLRQLGLGRQVDELEVAMNRAAEQAAAEARAIFVNAISDMRPRDVQAVFTGGPDAATRYLRGQSESELRERYRPIVASRLNAVNGYDYYRQLTQAWNRLPLVQPLQTDLDAYVTEQALDGLFTVLAREEERIREDPVARTTQLLRDVFGG
ncbi:MAG: DUF4197 domain-containing protein [Ectothiorhodospiraceae bacterium]|nr:DUF4197 domain-containing protein [Ectothiorhodospiraceae bacterium]MCH8505624.1 DUF4197 domain-containing protein [Ectothiorhodospiraceae bacterium]